MIVTAHAVWRGVCMGAVLYNDNTTAHFARFGGHAPPR